MINTARGLLTRHPRAEWLIPAALCLIMLVQMLCSVRQMSQHADEATHLYAGYRALKCGDYTLGREHPPLAKMLVAIPLLWSNPPINCAQLAVDKYGVEYGTDWDYSQEDQATDWLYSQDNWWHLLTEARVASSIGAVALCMGVWIAARRMFGRAAAVVSTTALAFEPNILGHGALLLSNVLLSALFLLTVFTFYLWTRQRSVPLLVGTGLLMGLALLTKNSAVLLAPMLILLALAEAWLEKKDKREAAGRALGNLGAVAAIGIIAAATIWCGYGMRYSGGSRGTEEELASMNSADVRIVKAVRSAHLLPQDYLDGMLEVRALVTHGSDTIDLLGRPYTAAPWFYFPLTTTIKFTVPFLAMLALGGAGLFAMGRDRKREILFVLLPALLFLALSTRMQRTAAGIWHLFPMLPFLLIAAGAGCVYLARRYRWAGGVLVCLLVLHAVSSLRAYPNYLSYANELWGGPQNLPKHLPWTDLNQTYWEVSRYMEQHPNTPCWVSSNWLVPVSKYNAPCTMIGNHSETDLPLRMKGIVFVSSSWLQVYGHPGTPLSPFYSIFHGVEPKARLGGGAVLVYEGEFDTHIAAATILDDRILRLLRSRINPAAILPPAEKLVEFEPTSFRSHDLYCIALTANRNVRQAFGECTIALRLAKADPLTLPAVPGITQQLNVLSQLNGAPLGM